MKVQYRVSHLQRYGVTVRGNVTGVFPLQFHRNLHAVNTNLSHLITPNIICAEPSVDGRVTAETCRGIDS
jgi:hypothetical protein